MECEKCPIRYYCDAYEEAERDNRYSYHSQNVVRVTEYSEPSCPIVKLIKEEVE